MGKIVLEDLVVKEYYILEALCYLQHYGVHKVFPFEYLKEKISPDALWFEK